MSYSRQSVIASLVLGVLTFILLLQPVSTAVAQDDQVCFEPTGYCLSGRFLTYWQDYGGLAVFGYPISPAREVIAEDGTTVLTQLFERQRFELHPDNPPPYDVLLGRLGAESLQNQGYDWQQEPSTDPRAGCRYFAETGHNVCESYAPDGQSLLQTDFRTYWENNGVRDPALNPDAQSLALFGLPLTEAYVLVNSSGEQVVAQVFERARLERPIPDGDAPGISEFGVLQGRLGSELAAQTRDTERVAAGVVRLVDAHADRLIWIGEPTSPDAVYPLYMADSNDTQPTSPIGNMGMEWQEFTNVQVDDTYVYGASSNGPILRRPLAGGAVETVAEPPRGVRLLTLDGTFLYWTDASGFINRVSTQGGQSVELVQSGGQVRDLALDDQYVYWYRNDGTVGRVAKEGGDPQTVLADIGDGSVGQLAVDDTHIYLVYGVIDATMPGGVVKASKEGGTVTTLATERDPLSLTLDDTHVYWSTRSGYVKTVAQAGGPVTILATGQAVPNEVVVSADSVYWRNEHGALMRASIR